MASTPITATAPAKAILLGEHAVNRGQAALSVSVGLYTTCTLTVQHQEARDAEAPVRRPDRATPSYSFISGDRSHTTTREAVLELGRAIDVWRHNADYPAIQHVAAADFFAPAKYVLAALGDRLPPNMELRFSSAIPQSAGLGSGGASFVALAAALARLLGEDDPRTIAAWAQRGDIVAHGGIASGLDTQTSLYGGAIRYTADVGGQPIPYADELTIVIGNTGVFAATSDVNGRVRAWLAERPSRLHYFQEIGLLSRQAEIALREGHWAELGHLLNLNQLILERIGVSCPELETLNEAALEAGALGAKLSGSGGGGIMLALVTRDRLDAVAQAITRAGGSTIVAPIAVPGVRVEP